MFARETAAVLAANGIKAYIYPRLEPTPALSWAVRYYGCGAGVCVTASHNPKEYNGYKVYWSDGAQLPDHAGSCRKDFGRHRSRGLLCRAAHRF